jgi:hypothetical protein
MANLGDDKGSKNAVAKAPRFLDAPRLDRVLGELRAIERQSGIERTLAIGRLILDDFFAGKPELWRDRRRGKHHSIRRLAEMPECPYSKSTLNEAIGVYVASLLLPCVRTFGHVGMSHVASVLTLPVAEQQVMLERAERERLSVRELREHVVNARRTAGERRGRPTLGDFAKTVSAVESEVRHLLASINRLDELALADSDIHARLSVLSADLSGASLALAALATRPAELRRTSGLLLRDRTG